MPNPQLGLQFSPSDDKPASGTALIILNHIAMNAIELLLKGSAHIPRITFDLGSTLYFRCVRIGCSLQSRMFEAGTS